MANVMETPKANAAATVVADRCTGPKQRKDTNRYATIWQAARLGYLEAMKERA